MKALIAKHYLGWEGWHGVCTTGDVAAGFPPSIVFADAVPSGPGLAPGLVNDDAPASSSPLANGIPGALSLNEGVSVDNGTAVPSSGPWLAPGLVKDDAPASGSPLANGIPGALSLNEGVSVDIGTAVLSDTGSTAAEAALRMDDSAFVATEEAAASMADVAVSRREASRLVDYAGSESGAESGLVYEYEQQSMSGTPASAPATGETPGMAPIAGSSAAAGEVLTAPSYLMSSPSNPDFGGDDVAAAQAPRTGVTPPNPLVPSLERRQAYVDMKFGLFMHYGINTYAGWDGHDKNGPKSALFTSPPGVPSWNPAPSDAELGDLRLIIDEIERTNRGVTPRADRTWPSHVFRAPYDNQADIKRYVTDGWARLAKEAGMKYMTLTTKHHWGWCLWPSDYTTYDIATSATPNIDFVKALFDSAREYDLKVGLYYSLPDRVHYHYGHGGKPHLALTYDEEIDANPPSQPREWHDNHAGNDNADYLEFAKGQVDELMAYDTEGDRLVSMWIDHADGVFADEWLVDFRDHITSRRDDVVQFYNKAEEISGIDVIEDRRHVNRSSRGAPGEVAFNIYEGEVGDRPNGTQLLYPPPYDIPAHGETTANRKHGPRIYNWFLYYDLDTHRKWHQYLGDGRSRDPVRGGGGAYGSATPNPLRLVGDIERMNSYNLSYHLNVPPGPNGLQTPKTRQYLQAVGVMLNGGGRIDDYDLGWKRSGSWTAFPGAPNAGTRTTFASPASASTSWQKTLHYAT